MRRIDVWVGRTAAVVGLLYVLLASLWPLTASGAVASTSAAIAAGRRSLPILADLRLARAIADTSAAGDERRRARRAVVAATIADTPQSWAMLLVAAFVFCTAVVATWLRGGDRRRPRAVTGRSACRPRPAAAA